MNKTDTIPGLAESGPYTLEDVDLIEKHRGKPYARLRETVQERDAARERVKSLEAELAKTVEVERKKAVDTEAWVVSRIDEELKAQGMTLQWTDGGGAQCPTGWHRNLYINSAKLDAARADAARLRERLTKSTQFIEDRHAEEVEDGVRFEEAEAEEVVDDNLAALSATDSDEWHSDDSAVMRFAEAMRVKLAKKRVEGRGGWEGPTCNAASLSRMPAEHVLKGDPVDVANFAMMLHQRGERIDSCEWLAAHDAETRADMEKAIEAQAESVRMYAAKVEALDAQLAAANNAAARAELRVRDLAEAVDRINLPCERCIGTTCIISYPHYASGWCDRCNLKKLLAAATDSGAWLQQRIDAETAPLRARIAELEAES